MYQVELGRLEHDVMAAICLTRQNDETVGNDPCLLERVFVEDEDMFFLDDVEIQMLNLKVRRDSYDHI